MFLYCRVELMTLAMWRNLKLDRPAVPRCGCYAFDWTITVNDIKGYQVNQILHTWNRDWQNR